MYVCVMKIEPRDDWGNACRPTVCIHYHHALSSYSHKHTHTIHTLHISLLLIPITHYPTLHLSLPSSTCILCSKVIVVVILFQIFPQWKSNMRYYLHYFPYIDLSEWIIRFFSIFCSCWLIRYTACLDCNSIVLKEYCTGL